MLTGNALWAQSKGTELYHCEDEQGDFESNVPCDEACIACCKECKEQYSCDETECPNLITCEKCGLRCHEDSHKCEAENKDEDLSNAKDAEDGTGGGSGGAASAGGSGSSGGSAGNGNGNSGSGNSNGHVGKNIGDATHTDKHFVSYQKGQCLEIAKKIMATYISDQSYGSPTKVYQPAKENGGTTSTSAEPVKSYLNVNKDAYFAAKRCIETHINEEHPIIVGVDHTARMPNRNEGTTDHFIVIVGYDFDERGNEYLIYLETGTVFMNKQFNDLNVLNCDDENCIFSGTGTSNRYYTITQIRPNDGGYWPDTINTK